MSTPKKPVNKSKTAGKSRVRKKTTTKKKTTAKKKPTTPKKEKFSFIKVTVARLPGQIKEIALNGGRTVRDALTGAELDGDGYEVRVNGVITTDLSTDLKANDQVLLVKKIKGNTVQ